jgi:hypothetical protein
MAIQYPNMMNPSVINALSENKYDAFSPNSKAIKMITTDLTIDKIEGKRLMDVDLRF